MLRFFAACRAPQLSLRALSSVANVDVVDAAERIARGAVYVDCRAESEFVSGAVAGAINCPFPHNDAGGVTNEAFLDDVAQVVQRSDSILVVRVSCSR
jgi:rhodanese-related sulfurtransferase